MTGMFHAVSAAGYASVATWSTTRFSSISLSMLWASKIEHKKNASGQLLTCAVSQTSGHGHGPVRVRDHSAFPRGSFLAQERELRGM
jgi:hypothetical protein